MDLKVISPADMAADLMQGFAWGLALRQSGNEISDLAQLPKLEKEILNEEIMKKSQKLFASKAEPEELFKKLDELVDRYSGLEDLREFLYDLVVLRIIVEGEEGDEEEEADVFDSEAWMALEDAAEDRGTELLNLLIYLKDCQENEIRPTLHDFLHEFLLAEETEHQEEFFLYEPLIEHQELEAESWESIIEIGSEIEEEEMQDIFIPVMMFFKTLGKSSDQALYHILNNSPQPDIHAGVYNLLTRFYSFLMSDSLGLKGPSLN